MFTPVIRRAVLLFAAAGLTACETPLEERIIPFDAVGFVRVVVFRDLNANDVLDANDAPVQSGQVVIQRAGAPDDSLILTTNEFGVQFSEPVSVGSYIARLPAGLLGDTIVRIQADTTF